MKSIYAVAVVMLLVMCSAASAALTDWGSGTVTTVNDPDEGFMPGREILTAWHKFEAGQHYFRIDLEQTPMGPPNLPPSFSGIYGIAINVFDGQGANGFHPYLTYAPEVVDIDFLIDAHYESLSHLPNPVQLQFAQYHEWDGTSFSFETLADAGGEFERDGVTLEWSIPDSAIGSPGSADFLWCAYTLDAGSETAKYDLACVRQLPPPPPIPEPATIAALGMALAGLGGYMRRRLRH